ncbi:MAG: hypothetical protein OEV94_02685 [Deltaproteobacteria bacterium]|nr:hypothetical protein [Deltaproteobacteria bacterium]
MPQGSGGALFTQRPNSMWNLIRVTGGKVEIPSRSLSFRFFPPQADLVLGLQALDQVRLDPTHHWRPVEERRQVAAFLARLGRKLYGALLPGGAAARLEPGRPWLLDLPDDMAAWPWELMNDGQHWVGLEEGIFRRVESRPRQAPPLFSPPMGVLLAQADPLFTGTQAMDATLAAQAEQLGERVFTPMEHGLFPLETPHWLARALPHAQRANLEALLEQGPALVHYSGWASTDGWWLEGPQGGPERTGRAWLAERFEGAVRRGTRMVWLSDSLGLCSPAQGTAHDRLLLEAGVQGVARLGGRVPREPQGEYLEVLARHLSRGQAPWKAHLAALRRMAQADPEGWNWCWWRMTLPPQPETPPRPRVAGPAPSAWLASSSVPPVLAPRRRVLGRAGALAQALGALEKGQAVAVSGAPGAGKTTLLVEAARRAAQDGRVIYLDQTQVPGGEEPPADGLWKTLGRALFPAQPPPGETAREQVLASRGKPGAPLLVLDGWETLPGGRSVLAEVAQGGNCLLTMGGEGFPELVAARVGLDPWPAEALIRRFGGRLKERLPNSPAWAVAAGSDLLTARLLSGWPAELPQEPGEDTGQGTAIGGQGTAPGLFSQLLPHLSSGHRQLLGVLTLVPGPMAVDGVLAGAGISKDQGLPWLRELHRLGVVDLLDNGRFCRLAPRLRPAAEPLAQGPTRAVWAARLAQATLDWLAQAGLPAAEQALWQADAWPCPQAHGRTGPAPRGKEGRESMTRLAQRLWQEGPNLGALTALGQGTPWLDAWKVALEPLSRQPAMAPWLPRPPGESTVVIRLVKQLEEPRRDPWESVSRAVGEALYWIPRVGGTSARRLIELAAQWASAEGAPLAPGGLPELALGRLAMAEGRWAEAEQHFARTAEGSQRHGHGAALARLAAAEAVLTANPPALDRARTHLEAAMDGLGPDWAPRWQEALWQTLVNAAWAGAHPLAAPAAEQLAEFYRQRGDGAALTDLLDQLGKWYFRQGMEAQATRCYQERLAWTGEEPATGSRAGKAS